MQPLAWVEPVWVDHLIPASLTYFQSIGPSIKTIEWMQHIM